MGAPSGRAGPSRGAGACSRAHACACAPCVCARVDARGHGREGGEIRSGKPGGSGLPYTYALHFSGKAPISYIYGRPKSAAMAALFGTAAVVPQSCI